MVNSRLQIHDDVILLFSLAEELLLALETFKVPDLVGLLDFLLLHVELAIQTLELAIEIILEALAFSGEGLFLMQLSVTLLLLLFQMCLLLFKVAHLNLEQVVHRVISITLKALLVHLLQLLQDAHFVDLRQVGVLALDAALALQSVRLTDAAILLRLLDHDLLGVLFIALHLVDFVVVDELGGVGELLSAYLEVGNAGVVDP